MADNRTISQLEAEGSRQRRDHSSSSAFAAPNASLSTNRIPESALHRAAPASSRRVSTCIIHPKERHPSCSSQSHGICSGSTPDCPKPFPHVGLSNMIIAWTWWETEASLAAVGGDGGRRIVRLHQRRDARGANAFCPALATHYGCFKDCHRLTQCCDELGVSVSKRL